MTAEVFDYSDLQLLPIENPDLKDVNLMKILYSEEFTLMITRMNALIRLQEYSPRALQITDQVISKVPSNYTAWEYRLNIVKCVCSETDLVDELNWCNERALHNEKNYQIWNYKEHIIEHLVTKFYNDDKSLYDLKSEYEITEQMISNDEKNYHVWTHKRWMVRFFNLFGDQRELLITEQLIQSDVRNNSAWNHRLFVLTSDLKDELLWVTPFAQLAPTNPSVWLYIRGLMTKGLSTESVERILYLGISKLSLPALELKIDILESQKNTQEALQLCHKMETQLDTIRKNYWRYRAEMLSNYRIG